MRSPWTEVVLFGLAYMAGDAFSAPQWVTIVVGGGVGIAALGWAIDLWRTRHKRRADRQASEDHALATRADRYATRQENRRQADELRAFEDSSEGWLIRQMPAVVKDSVRILPIEQRPRGDPFATGEFFIRLDDNRVAAFDFDPARHNRTWRQRVASVSLWIATRSWLAGRPGTTRVFEWITRRITPRLPRRYKASRPRRK